MRNIEKPLSQMTTKPTHVAITGASSGIGAQLALLYARDGAELSLSARRAEQLNTLADKCRDLGATVHTTTLDVRNNEAVGAWCETAHRRQPIDLIIANAGVFDGNGPDGALESASEARNIVEINLLGAIYTVQAAIKAMRHAGNGGRDDKANPNANPKGHIAVVSSLAAILPAADAPAYSASKAALVAYCDAIRRMLVADNIRVSVILPGHVESAQTAVHNGPLAFIIPAHKAAEIIKRDLARGKTQIAFPLSAHWLVRIASWLPWRVRELATRSDRFHVRKDQK